MTETEIQEFRNVGALEVKGLRPELEAMLERAIAGCRTLLDHGCGFGGWTAYFLKRNAGFRFKAFDPDQEGQAYTCALAPARCDQSLDRFDVILCFGVLELLPEAEQVALLRSFAAQLNPGGRCLIQYNVFNLLAPRWFVFFLAGRGRAQAFHQRFRFNRTYFGYRKVAEILERGGFRIVEREVNGFWHKLPRQLDRAMTRVITARHFYSQFFYWLEPVETSAAQQDKRIEAPIGS